MRSVCAAFVVTCAACSVLIEGQFAQDSTATSGAAGGLSNGGGAGGVAASGGGAGEGGAGGSNAGGSDAGGGGDAPIRCGTAPTPPGGDCPNVCTNCTQNKTICNVGCFGIDSCKNTTIDFVFAFMCALIR